MQEPETPSPFSPAFRDTLATGKYTKWAADLDVDNLLVVLWAVGEFGVRMPSEPSLPITIGAGVRGSTVRASFALQTLARIVHGEALSWAQWRRELAEALDAQAGAQ